MKRLLNTGRGHTHAGASARAALVAILLIAFASGASAQQKLVVGVGQWNIENEYGWREAIDLFTAANPGVEIEVLGFTGTVDDVREQLLVHVAAGTHIDVVAVHPANFLAIVNSGLLQPLDKHLAVAGAPIDDFVPAFLDSFTVNGELYGLPLMVNSQVVAYNKTHLDNLGIPEPTADWTWEEAAQSAHRARRVNEEGEVIIAGYSHLWTGFWHHHPVREILWAYGADYFSPDGTELTLHTPQALEALNFIHKYRHETRAFEEASLPKGRAAFARINSGGLRPLREADLGFEVGIQSNPHGPEGNFNSISAWGYALAKNARDPELAIKFIEYATGEGYLKTSVAYGNTLPARFSHIQSIEFENRIDEFWQDRRVWTESIETGRPSILSANASAAINDVLTPEWHAFWEGEQSIESFVERVKGPVDAILQQDRR